MSGINSIEAEVQAYLKSNCLPQTMEVVIGTVQCQGRSSTALATLDNTAKDFKVKCEDDHVHTWASVRLSPALQTFKLKKHLKAAIDSWMDLEKYLPIQAASPFDTKCIEVEEQDTTDGTMVGHSKALAQYDPDKLAVVVGTGSHKGDGAKLLEANVDVQFAHGVLHWTKTALLRLGPRMLLDLVPMLWAAKSGDEFALHFQLNRFAAKYLPDYLQVLHPVGMQMLSNVVRAPNGPFIRDVCRIQEINDMADPVPPPQKTHIGPGDNETEQALARMRDRRAAGD